MIAPPSPRRSMSRRHSRVVRNAPSRWMASIFFQSARLKSVSLLTIWMPALDTSTSTRPWRATTPAMPSTTCRSSVTSIATAMASPPASRIAWAAASAAPALRSAMATLPPAAAYTSAMRRPMPLAAPVTTQTLPSSRFMGALRGGGLQDSAEAWGASAVGEIRGCRQFHRHPVGVAGAGRAQPFAQARRGLDDDVVDHVLLQGAAERLAARAARPDADVVAAVRLRGHGHQRFLHVVRVGGVDGGQVGAPDCRLEAPGRVEMPFRPGRLARA